MKKTDIVKLALSGWKLSDIKELVELEKTMNDIETKEDEKDDKKEDEKDDKTKTMNDMMELIKKLQDDKTREKIKDDKNEEDILKDMFRDFM